MEDSPEKKVSFKKGILMMNRRRKRMEVAANGNGGGGEVRRLHIIYFLSHMGHVEHPHLIRVHHLTKNGVCLRDVKRWFAEVRGKDMPEAFTWSYKRRYKSGYVWQDLLDDDLITPISDNEYVLKGSESIPYTTFDTSLFGKKDSPISVNDQQPTEVKDQHSSKEGTTPKMSPEIFKESQDMFGFDVFGSDRSSITDDSMKLHEEDMETVKLSNDIDSNNNNNNNGIAKTTATMGTAATDSSRSSSKSQFAKSKSYSNGASNMLRNLMKCGAVDTNDAVAVTVNRGDKPGVAKSVTMQDPGAVICQGDKRGSARVFGTQWNHNQQQQQNRARKSFDGMAGSKRKNEFTNIKPVSSAYKPAGAPTCSQCGKLFKPEKMHKHMKSCKGMKNLKTTASGHTEKTPTQRSFNLSPEKSASGYLLTN